MKIIANLRFQSVDIKVDNKKVPRREQIVFSQPSTDFLNTECCENFISMLAFGFTNFTFACPHAVHRKDRVVNQTASFPKGFFIPHHTIPYNTLLYYSTLYFTILQSAMLTYSIRFAIPCYAMLRSALLRSALSALLCSALLSAMLCYAMPCHAVLNCCYAFT